ncbi:hypothetical protein H5410_028273 [Solanum commersonii]|uniref:Uncharacterized protein n=1 Tax=Solanum commersonii TaxID=4109 RepID=A0A9J5Z3K0_SOLCO|nr:hypothetical protein H5410_028273 [Solanum commersonii]
MDESFNYNEHFEKYFSPTVSDVSPHPILEFYRESWREKRLGIENADLIDDTQSKLQSVGQNSQMEKESDIITNVKGSDSLPASTELLDKSLASTLIGGLKGDELKLQGSVKLVDKVLPPTMILGGEGFDSILLASAELLDKSLALTSISGLERSEPKLQGFAELVDKVLPSLIQGDEGSELKQQGSLEHVNEVLTPSMIRGCEDNVKEKRKRKKKQSFNAKDDVKEKQSSNVDDDSWLLAGWSKIVRYHKMGKLVGYSYNTFFFSTEDIQTISISDQVIASQAKISGTGVDVVLNANT